VDGYGVLIYDPQPEEMNPRRPPEEPPEDLVRNPLRGRIAGRIVSRIREEPRFYYLVRLEPPHLVRWAPGWFGLKDHPLEEILGRSLRWVLLFPAGMRRREIGEVLRHGGSAEVGVAEGDAPGRMPRQVTRVQELDPYRGLFRAWVRRAEDAPPPGALSWVAPPAAPPAELPPGLRVVLSEPSHLFGWYEPPPEHRGWRLRGRLIGRRRFLRKDGELHLHLLELDPPDTLRWAPYAQELGKLGRPIRFALLSPIAQHPLPGPLPLPDPVGQALARGEGTRVRALLCEGPDAVPDPMTGADFVPLEDYDLCFHLEAEG
jgi:hypothetical protein